MPLPPLVQRELVLDCARKDDLPEIDLAKFSEPWRFCFDVMSREKPENALHELTQEIYKRREWDADAWGEKQAFIDQLYTALDGPPLLFPSLAELSHDLEPITWLWKGWIPRGMLTLFGAVPGAGKSYLALDFARRVITAGETFPDGQPIPSHGPVVYVDAEVVPQMLSERASAWEMDTRQLYLMLPPQYSYIDLTTQRDQDTLITMLHVLRPELVIIDSLSSISTRGENSVEDVRQVLSFLAQMAEEYQCGVLLVHHLRKRGITPLFSTITIDDFRGSGHIIAMSRSVLGLSVIQDSATHNKNGPRQLEIVKTNLGPYPPPLGVEIVSLDSNPDYASIEYGKPPVPYREPTQVELCAEWLLELLTESREPLKPAEIIELAAEEDFSRGTVYRAREFLGPSLESTGNRRDPTTKWGTPESIATWQQEIEREKVELEEVIPKFEQAADWLFSLLTKGNFPSGELLQLAADAGFSKNTVYKAKESLDGQVVSRRGVWSLVSHA